MLHSRPGHGIVSLGGFTIGGHGYSAMELDFLCMGGTHGAKTEPDPWMTPGQASRHSRPNPNPKASLNPGPSQLVGL